MRLVRSKLDFIFVWEIERRMRPFGPLEWGEVVSEQLVASLSGAERKSEALARLARALRTPAPEPLRRGQVHAFAARVDTAGTFFPLPPLASLSNRMFRVYGPHRFLRVHYADPLPKHLRLQTLNLCGRRYELLYCDLAGRTIIYFATKGTGLAKEVSVETVREWHIPLSESANLDLSLAKYNARFSLAFSDSVPTVCFDQLTTVPGEKKNFLFLGVFFLI
jgi:hypothetical protein